MINRMMEIRRWTAPMVALTVLAGCSEEPAGPVEIEGTGSIEGFVFLDANEDGIFDPSDGDRPLEGVRVVPLSRSTEEAIGSPAVSGADGRFQITGLPPGTHDLLFDEETVPEGANVCRNPLPATVYLDESQFVDVAGRPACLISIAEAQALAEGDFAIVRGIVTAAPGAIQSNFVYIEDETGGIFLFASALMDQGIEVGDLVEVGGEVSFFNDQLQLNPVTLREHVPDVADPQPVEVTTAEIAAAGAARDPLQGRFAVVRGAELVTGFTSGGGRNATIDDGSGATVIRVASGVSAENEDAILTNLGLTVGNCYDIEGAIGTFFGTAQLFPRSAADFTEVPCT